VPIHDWTRVDAGIFHAFHHSWIEEIARALNRGLLPPDHYALLERHAAGFGPEDVLTLQDDRNGGADDAAAPGPATTGRVLVAAPKLPPTAETDLVFYRRKQSSIAVRHVSGDRIVAMVEVVSPGNKAARNALHAFVQKAAELLDKGVHLLIIDLHPPGKRDPDGIHGEIWQGIAGQEYTLPENKPLTLAAYETGDTVRLRRECRSGRRLDGHAAPVGAGESRRGPPGSDLQRRVRGGAPALAAGAGAAVRVAASRGFVNARPTGRIRDGRHLCRNPQREANLRELSLSAVLELWYGDEVLARRPLFVRPAEQQAPGDPPAEQENQPMNDAATKAGTPGATPEPDEAEAMRLQLLAEAGEVAQAPGQMEALLDRAHLADSFFEEHVLQDPACLRSPELFREAWALAQALAGFYQRIGQVVGKEPADATAGDAAGANR
jgi:hypothetical protein